MKYKILPHTADLRLKIYGKDYEELFQNAALGLANILYNNIAKKEKFIRGFENVSMESSDAITLLVGFLNEILSLSNIEKKVYPRVKILRISPTAIDAHILGVPVDHFDEDVKAVSYHNAEVRETDGGLETELVLDI